MSESKETEVMVDEYLYSKPEFIPAAYVVASRLLPPDAPKVDVMNLMLGERKKKLAIDSNMLVVFGQLVTFIAAMIIVTGGANFIYTHWQSEWKTGLYVAVGLFAWYYTHCAFKTSRVNTQLLLSVDPNEEEALFEQFQSFQKLIYRLAEAKQIATVPTTIEQLRSAVCSAMVYFAKQINEFKKSRETSVEGLIRGRLKDLAALSISLQIFDTTEGGSYVEERLIEEAFHQASMSA